MFIFFFKYLVLNEGKYNEIFWGGKRNLFFEYVFRGVKV